eukprot:scaffold359134_cov47-Attheya_sp.AAC.1
MGASSLMPLLRPLYLETLSGTSREIITFAYGIARAARIVREDPTQRFFTKSSRTCLKKSHNSLEQDLLDRLEFDEDIEDDRVTELLQVSRDLDDPAGLDDEYYKSRIQRKKNRLNSYCDARSRHN